MQQFIQMTRLTQAQSRGHRRPYRPYRRPCHPCRPIRLRSPCPCPYPNYAQAHLRHRSPLAGVAHSPCLLGAMTFAASCEVMADEHFGCFQEVPACCSVSRWTWVGNGKSQVEASPQRLSSCRNVVVADRASRRGRSSRRLSGALSILRSRSIYRKMFS